LKPEPVECLFVYAVFPGKVNHCLKVFGLNLIYGASG